MSAPKPLATFWRQATPGTTYWRCSVPAKHLPGRVWKLLTSDLVKKRGKYRIPEQKGKASIWQFAGNATNGVLMALLQEQGYRVLMEVDDNYLIPSPGMYTWNVDYSRGGSTEDGDKPSLAANRRISEWVDGVICSTERLADIYSEVNEHVYHCPNSIEPEDWAEPAPKDGPLKIIWAGSGSHHVDSPLVRRALEWAVKQRNVEVYLVGYGAPIWRGQFKRLGWTNSMDEHRARLSEINADVGICALYPGAWADCKSDVKALEYGITGAVSICSDVEAYRPLKGKPALWARSAKDFSRAIEWCVWHPDEVREMGQKAREYVLAERQIKDSIYKWREAVRG